MVFNSSLGYNFGYYFVDFKGQVLLKAKCITEEALQKEKQLNICVFADAQSSKWVCKLN